MQKRNANPHDQVAGASVLGALRGDRRGDKVEAIDQAVGYYLQMRGNSRAYPTGAVETPLEAAEQRGSLTGGEIAEILNYPELPLQYEVNTTWWIGNAND